MKRANQRGFSLWVILLAIAILVLGSWQYSKSRSKQARTKVSAEAVAQNEDPATAERKAIEKQQDENEDRATVERKAIEKRQAEAKKQQDALQVSLRTVDDLLSRWDDAVRVAGSTSRMSLATPVGMLQAMKREAEQLTVPPCLDSGKAELVKAMEASVEGYLAFMRNEAKLGDMLAQVYLVKAEESMKAFKNARLACPVPDGLAIAQ